MKTTIGTTKCTWNGSKNIVFLDWDGVVQINRDRETTNKKLELVKILIESTKAKIVLSSNRRIDKGIHYIIKCFEENEISYDKDIIPFTSLVNDMTDRASLIELWLTENRTCVDKFVILDDKDINLSNKFRERFFQTINTIGLTESIIGQAIKLLNGQEHSYSDSSSGDSSSSSYRDSGRPDSASYRDLFDLGSDDSSPSRDLFNLGRDASSSLRYLGRAAPSSTTQSISTASRVSSSKSSPPSPQGIFVYGTLRPDILEFRDKYGVCNDDKCKFQRASIEGFQLYQDPVQNYPYIVKSPSGRVHGYYIYWTPPHLIHIKLIRCDRIEGYHRDSASNLYEREIQDIQLENGAIVKGYVYYQKKRASRGRYHFPNGDWKYGYKVFESS